MNWNQGRWRQFQHGQKIVLRGEGRNWIGGMRHIFSLPAARQASNRGLGQIVN